jgi:putative FmdB family regulatory protein
LDDRELVVVPGDFFFGRRQGKERSAFGKRRHARKALRRLLSVMPLYEYICRSCHHKFDQVLTIKEHETKKLTCPKCQSTDLEKVIEPFFAKTASKTRRY